MVWRFLKHYGVSKAHEVLDDFASAVVAYDPDTASKAQIVTMESELTRLGRRLAEAEAEVRREHDETAALRRTYEEYLQAAQLLESRVAGGSGPEIQNEDAASLEKIVAKLEQLKPEIEREEREDAEVEAWCAELRRAFEDLVGKLRQSKSDLQSARRQMDMAKLRKERAKTADRRAREAAGVSGPISAMTLALDAMNRQTAQMRAEADVLQLKAGVFQAEQLESDPNIAAVLREARGSTRAGGKSLSDRLTALQTGGAAARLSAAE